MPNFEMWTGTATPIVAVLVGVVLLLFGRRLFWLFVGVIGFVAGWTFALSAWTHVSPGARLILAVLAGLVGLVLALVAQKIAVALAGFFLGAYGLAHVLGWQLGTQQPAHLAVLVIAGVLAAFLALALFDYALIFYSSIAGAHLIVGHVPLHVSGDERLLLLVVLAVIGIVVQASLLRSRRVRRA
jgi:hypothetical protein